MVKLRSIVLGGLHWQVRDSIAPELRRVLEAPDSFLRDPAYWLKNCDLITLARVPHDTAGGVVLRRLNYGRLRHRLRDFFRASRVRRAFLNGLRMEQCGIRTPRSLAVAEVRRLRWPLRAYLIVQQVEGAIRLADPLLERGTIPKQVALATADLLARMHDSGFSHRDLKFTNILLDAKLEPWLIDLDGVRYHRAVSIERVASDLAVLARDFRAYPTLLRWYGARFLRRYCRRRGMEGRFRELVTRVLAEMRRL